MKLTFLGTGSAFTVGCNNYHSNMLLEDNNKNRLLIDCGSDARFSLFEQGFCYRDIHSVYISHLHADHAGGLEWLAFTTQFDSRCDRPHLYINHELLDELWNRTLSGGLSSLEGTHANLSTYFRIHPIKENGSFTWGKIRFKLIKTTHIVSGYSIIPSFGLFFKTDDTKILITTDTQFRPKEFEPYYHKADLIFHDCEVSKIKSGVHPHYSDLRTLDPDIKKKIWLYHYNCEKKMPDSKKDGFRGFVKKGQVFNF